MPNSSIAAPRMCPVAMSNATTAAKRLEGHMPVIEVWHAEMAFLEVIWKYFLTPAQLGNMAPSTS